MRSGKNQRIGMRRYHSSYGCTERFRKTTGVAPFQLLYGRKPESPLSILKNSWTEEEKGLQMDTTSAFSYLQKRKK